jgi:hypothetical protein
MFREWGSVSISAVFFLASCFLIRWFWIIANKNLDYVGLGLNIRDKIDGYGLYMFLMFFILVIFKLLFYAIFSMRPNFIFDIVILNIFLILGISVISLKMGNYI